jgi:hypothetical protein
MLNKKETEKDVKTEFFAGQIVWLDNDLSNNSKVEVVEQTPMRLFTVVRSLDSGYTWNVMSYRLTPCI